MGTILSNVTFELFLYSLLVEVTIKMLKTVAFDTPFTQSVCYGIPVLVLLQGSIGNTSLALLITATMNDLNHCVKSNVVSAAEFQPHYRTSCRKRTEVMASSCFFPVNFACFSQICTP